MINEYWFDTLSVGAKSIYKNMVSSFSRMKFDVECGNVNPNVLADIYGAVLNDHPELFYLSFSTGASLKRSLYNSVVVFNSSNIFSAMEISQYKSTMESIAKKIKLSADRLKTEGEKEKLIVDYIIENVTYQIDMKYNQNAATCLVQNKAQCSGIARAIKYLCDYIGLWCIVITGDINDKATRTVGPHAWNIVKIDGKYYHLDVTQMLSINSTKIKPFKYLYYNYSDAEIKVNHVWKDKAPVCFDVYANKDSGVNAGGNGITALSSLYEVRVGLANALKNKETEFSFRSNIRCENDTELMKVVNLATSTAMKSSQNKVSSAQVSVQGGLVTVSFSYR